MFSNIQLLLILLTLLLLYINKTTAACASACTAGNYCSVFDACTACLAGYYCLGSAANADRYSGLNLCEVGYYCSGGIRTACATGYTTVYTGSTSVDRCMYLCTSSSGTGCCQSKVIIASSVTSIGIINFIIIIRKLIIIFRNYNQKVKGHIKHVLH